MKNFTVKKVVVSVVCMLVAFTMPTMLFAGKTTITYVSWDGGVGLELTRQIADAFEAENPDIEVEFIAASEGYDIKVQTMTLSGEAPDVVLCWNTPQFVESGLLMDLTDLIEEEQIDLDAFYAPSIGQATYKGRIYGLPKDATTRMIYYNKKLFDEAGVPYPQDGWTWADFEETVKKLTKGEGVEAQYGFYVPAGFTYQMQGYLWANGGDIVSPDGSKASGYVNAPQAVETMEFFKRLYAISAQAAIGDRITNPGETEFISGKIAMMDNGSWPTESLLQEGIPYGLVNIPVPNAADQPKPVWHGSFFGIGAKSKNKEAAWKLIKYFANEGQATFAKWGIPSRKATTVEVEMDKGPLAPFLASMDIPTVVPCFTRSPKYWEADAEFGKAMQQILLESADPQTALDEAAKQMDKILASK